MIVLPAVPRAMQLTPSMMCLRLSAYQLLLATAMPPVHMMTSMVSHRLWNDDMTPSMMRFRLNLRARCLMLAATMWPVHMGTSMVSHRLWNMTPSMMCFRLKLSARCLMLAATMPPVHMMTSMVGHRLWNDDMTPSMMRFRLNLSARCLMLAATMWPVHMMTSMVGHRLWNDTMVAMVAVAGRPLAMMVCCEILMRMPGRRKRSKGQSWGQDKLVNIKEDLQYHNVYCSKNGHPSQSVRTLLAKGIYNQISSKTEVARVAYSRGLLFELCHIKTPQPPGKGTCKPRQLHGLSSKGNDSIKHATEASLTGVVSFILLKMLYSSTNIIFCNI